MTAPAPTPQQKEALARLLIEALKKSDPLMVRGCMERGCDPLVRVQEGGKGEWRSGIHWAMVYFSDKCANEIFNAACSVNAKDETGETPLFTALREVKPDAVEYLMKKGANPVAQNRNGAIASDIAVSARTDSQYYRELRERMLKALTGPVVEENAGPTAQFNTASSHDVKVMKPITLQKADDEAPGSDDKAMAGKTPGFKL